MLYVTPNWVGRSEYVWFQTLRNCEGGLACIPHPQPDLPPPTLQSHAAKSAREDKRPFGGEPVSPAVPCSYQKKNLTVVTGPQTNRLRRSAAHALIGLSQTGHPQAKYQPVGGACTERPCLKPKAERDRHLAAVVHGQQVATIRMPCDVLPLTAAAMACPLHLCARSAAVK